MALIVQTSSNIATNGSGTYNDPYQFYLIDNNPPVGPVQGFIIFQCTGIGGNGFLTLDGLASSTEDCSITITSVEIYKNPYRRFNFSNYFELQPGEWVQIIFNSPNVPPLGLQFLQGFIYVDEVVPPPQVLPTSLSIIDQPYVSSSGSLLSTQPTLCIVDQFGSQLSGYDTDVQVSLVVISGSATLTGTTTVSTTSGVATFTDLVVTGNGLFYLQFDSTILALNSAFSNQLFFQPNAGNPNPPIPVKPKRSYIPGAVPAYTDLAVNEFAINVADRKGYIRDSNNIVHLLFDGYASGGGGTGGTVYSVGISSTDFDVTNSPVTTSGFIGLDLATQSITAGTYGDGSNTVSITVNSKGIITGISENALATSNWNAAYGWGDHSLAGYLTTETDPVFSASTAAGITGTDTGNWNTAYGWGDHSKAGYLSSVTTTDVSEGTNLYFTDARARAAVSAGTGISYDNITGVITNSDPDQLVTLTAGTDISITGTYPSFTINYSGSGGSGTVTSVAVSVPTGLTITSGSPVTTSGTIAIGYDTGYSIPLTADQTNWNTAYGWGNHASAGYLTSETDPVFVASTAYGITTTDTGNWNSAYSERRQWDGGSTNLVAATGRTSLGATTVGANFFTLTNPSAITFPRINANNTISALDAATFRSAIGAGTSSTTGTITSIVAGSYLTGGTITSTGTIAVDATSANTASKVVARDASGNFSAGVITASSINKVTITAPATSATITVADGKTLTASNTLTFTGTDASSVAFGTGGTVLYSGGALGTPSSGTLTNCTFPTLNQNTTGSSGSCTGNSATATKSTNIIGGNSTTLLGSIPYQSNTDTTSLLSPNTTTTKKFLRQTGTGTNGAAPAWDTVTASDIGLGNVSNTAQVTSVTGTSPVTSSGGTTPAISLASGYGDTQNPYASKTANYVLAAPNGLAGVPTFRALVAADIPTLNQNTTGTAAGLSATLAITSGGTGQTTQQAAINALTGTQSTGKYLRSDGTNATLSSIQAADVPTLNQNTTGSSASCTGNAATATSLAGGGAGQIPYQSSANTSAFLSAGTSGQILRSNGTNAPSWEVQGLFHGGRLTLTSGTPVTTSDVTAATTIYFTPYGANGDKISLYDGTNWATYTFSQLSLALGTLSSGFNYDVFVYNNGGTLTLETAVWTNDTTRATSLTLTNGIYLKTGALTRRYLGTFRTTSTTTTEDSIAKRFVWNFNNRVEKALYKNGTTSHTYTTASWRNWNNDATLRIEFILGIEAAQVIHFGGAATGTGIDIGAGFDGGTPVYDSVNSTGTGVSQMRGGRAYSSRGTFLGYHYCQMHEYGASGTTFLDARLEGTIWC